MKNNKALEYGNSFIDPVNPDEKLFEQKYNEYINNEIESQNQLISETLETEYYLEAPNYHSDWNHLMRIVDKIESLDLKEYMYSHPDTNEDNEPCITYNFEGTSVEIENNRCLIYIHQRYDPGYTVNEKSYNLSQHSKITAVYNAVLEFIEWYKILIKQ